MAEEKSTRGLRTVRLDDIKIQNRIRRQWGDIESLADSIREHGLMQPPVVTPGMQLIAGHRRIEACRLLGWEEIEVIVRDADEHERILLEITENMDRKEFTFSERLDCARQLEEIERVRAKERMEKGAGSSPKGVPARPGTSWPKRQASGSAGTTRRPST